MLILIFKSLHIISVLFWMGALLVLPRLFMLQTRANNLTEPDRSLLIKQYKGLSKTVMMKIAWPAAIAAFVFGFGMAHQYFSVVWFWIKMGLVLALFVYHHLIHFENKRLQKDNYTKNLAQLKSMNLYGLVFLASIVFITVFQAAINKFLIIGGVLALIVAIFLLGKSFAKKSSNASE